MNRFDPLPSVTLETLSAQLYPDETLISQQDGVGLYDGKDKSPQHYEGRLHLTSHRLIFVVTSSSSSSSSSIPVALSLSIIRQTEYWTGFLKSSPKITLILHPPPPPIATLNETSSLLPHVTTRTIRTSTTTTIATEGGDRSWLCRVCGMKNLPSLELGLKCSLCGIKHESSSTTHTPPTLTLTSTAVKSVEAEEEDEERPTTLTLESQSSTKPIIMISCPICTFLNHHSMNRCEMCDTPLPTNTTTTRPSTPTSKQSPINNNDNNNNNNNTSRPSTPSSSSSSSSSGGGDFVRLSFRKGGIQNFYNLLKQTLSNKTWDLIKRDEIESSRVEKIKLEVLKRKQQQQQQQQLLGGGEGVSGGSSSSPSPGGGFGIDAILRGIDLNSQTRTDSLQDAVKDLESLMRKAKEMIQLAQSINSQLLLSSNSTTSPSTTVEAEAASKLATKSLSSLGILSTVAVTSDQTRSEKDFHHSLARELSSLLQPPNTRGGGGGGGRGGLIEKRGGVIGLDELWCVWNRARGVSLVSPKNFKHSVQFLNLYTRDPILKLLTFPKSGLTVLISPQYDPRNFKNRLLGYIDEKRKTTNTATKARRRGITGVEEDKKEEEEEEEQTEGGIGLLEIAKLESLSLGLTKEMIELIELEQPTGASGEKVYGDGIVRDAGPGGGGGGGEGESQGVRWFRDYITGFEWDGQD